MKTFTSTLPENLFTLLDEAARRYSIPKNKIIEKAVSIYLDQLNKAEYFKSYKKLSDDDEMILMAEEGMAEYLKDIEDYETR